MNGEVELPPTILVVFGITGDLSRRYLLPALTQICSTSHLPKNFKILGVSRRDVNIKDVLGSDKESLKSLTSLIQIDTEDKQSYLELRNRLDTLSQRSEPQVIFYFAVPPVAVMPIVEHLGKSDMNGPRFNLLLEKPFGFDLESAQKLVAQTEKYFPEEQVYRIDHYLAKEMAQNIVVFLGSNTLFRDVWNHQFIEKIDIIVAEKIGLEGRADFYESTGALRDIVQSHLLQLAALTLMQPFSQLFDFEQLPEHRLSALKSLSSNMQGQLLRGQFEGYKKEVDNPRSLTETFVSLTLKSVDPRWTGVPINLISGKKLNDKLTEIRIYFKKQAASESNRLALRIQPKEGIELDLWVKEPGYERRLQEKSLSFTYEQHFERLPDAYERVLVDAMKGSHSLFASSQEVIESWRILQPIQEKWSKNAKDLFIYKAGKTVEDLIEHKNT